KAGRIPRAPSRSIGALRVDAEMFHRRGAPAATGLVVPPARSGPYVEDLARRRCAQLLRRRHFEANHRRNRSPRRRPRFRRSRFLSARMALPTFAVLPWRAGVLGTAPLGRRARPKHHLGTTRRDGPFGDRAAFSG